MRPKKQIVNASLPLYADRIKVGMDIAKNTYWKSYGGKPGLTYLLTEFRQELEARALGHYFETMFFANPKKLYLFKNGI
jgi:hypothetical protein